ncbi:hypothetical protein HanXRQr2_Chr10g0444471 [Helianthus annuus]|uniref:Uncharacterized protein n=1 Tax=Helianthus annuus TaxID=4232 RepID=A0A9K3HY81_HELAN|nr:uncharacterized protein At4g38062 [Helianthus annuus]KAF5786733.1 hypothetical protein HanXRQr2_Chr10g0444471 [Helianthus annuus]
MIDHKEMNVHEALEHVRAQNEKLEEEIHIKTDLCKNLKRAQDELITKLQEAKSQSEKQAQELSTKSDELSTLTQLHQDLKSSFQEKESALKHLNSATEKLRYEYGENVQKFEGENKELVLALEEAKTVSESLKSSLDSSNAEIEDLKRVLLLKDKKIVEISDKTQTARDLISRDEVISKLEEERRDVQDRLKWKNEQFQHLEEAHKKLQDSFKSSKTEWENEKSLLLQEICSLQTNLDSQTRISENLRTELRVCNQALAHEQSNKKLLEVEISEYKSRYDDIFSECHEAKLTIEKLSHKRDEEVAELRDTLAAKDSLSKEMGYKLEHLERENTDLIASLKEFQESQINSGNTGSLKKLQKKYNSLEQAHKKCSEKLKVEVELKSELERLKKEIDDYSIKLKDQSEHVMQLQEELKSCRCLPEVQKLVELEKGKLFVERQNMQLEAENQRILCRVNEQNEKNVDLQQQLVLLETLLTERTEAQKKEKENNLAIIEEIVKEKQKLENEVSCLCEEVKVKDESLLKSTRRAEELENLLRVTKLETENLMDENTRLVNNVEAQNRRIEELFKEKTNVLMISEEKQKLEDEFSCLCEEVKVKDESLLKSTQRVEELEDLLRVNKLETENLRDENTRLMNNLEAQKRRIEELVKEKTNVLMISEEKQKLEDEFSCLCEEVKVKDESLSKSTQRAEELEDMLQVNKLETEKLRNENTRLVNNLEAQNQRIEELLKEKTTTLMIFEEKQKLENKFSCLCEEVKVKDESLLKSTQRAEELEDLLRVNKLETENLIDENMRLVNNLEAQNRRIEELDKEMTHALMIIEEKQILEDELSGLCEQVKVKDECLLKSTQRAEELEDLLRVNKLETKNLMDENMRLVNDVEAQNRRIEELDKEKINALTILEEKQNEIDVIHQDLRKLEDEISSLCEKVKVKDESLLKSTQRAEELEDLLRVSRLETEKLMYENTRLVNNLEAQNRRIEQLEKEKTNALTISEEKQIQIDVIHQDLHKLENEISCLCEKVKVKDESLLKSTQRAEELEDLLRVNKLETKNLMDENARMVNNLEAQNQALCEDIEKIRLHKEDSLIQMENASRHMEECFKDVELTRMLENMLQRC